MPPSSLEKQLRQLGFSAPEAQVYLTLLRSGGGSVGPLISKTQLHRNVVYTALDKLVAQKLVMTKQVKGKKAFSPASPAFLAETFQQQAVTAVAVVRDLGKLMKHDDQEITIHQGNEEYLRLLTGLLKALPKGGTKYVLGTGGEAFMENTMRPIWEAYHKVARERQIEVKMLGYERQRSSFAAEAQAEKVYNIRYLPENIENPAGVHIYPEAQTVLNIIYSDSVQPVTAIRIRNAALVEGYLNLFRNLWKTAKK